MAKSAAEPKWRGGDPGAGGRPRILTISQKTELRKLVFREKAKAKVTVKFCRKKPPYLRNVSKDTVRLALHTCGLKWLVRRNKKRIIKPHKAARLAYCKWVLKQPDTDLRRYAYTDGTTFYLARTLYEKSDQETLGLGKYVWRMANGKDGLWEANVGPSCYAKSQGLPVKIWGMFARGRLHYFVLPKDGPTKTCNMTGARYNKVVKTHFSKWRRSCFLRGRAFLVKDHERCLWQQRNLDAEK